MKQTKHILLTAVMLLSSLATRADIIETPIDIASRANEMLYSNAPCTNTTYGDQFVGWHVLYDGDANTFFHSEYSNKESVDGLDHYLRVDMGAGNSIKWFTFAYTVRGNDMSYTPTRIVVEGSNEAFGDYEEIAVLTDLPTEKAAVYTSEILGHGTAYRYIRYRVTETFYNNKVQGHPYFYFAEFGMTNITIKGEGVCGDNLTWTLLEEMLTISGTGSMYDYVYDSGSNITNAPWSYECPKFIQSVTIEEGVTSIGEFAFRGCSRLTAITIPESVTSIGSCAFNGTAWYNDQPDGVLYIGKMLYNYKGNMPENTAIEVKEGTVSISPCAFHSCSNLTSITIPESVTSIGDGAFYGCSSLTTITCEATTPPTIGGSYTFNNIDKSIPVYVPLGSVDAYKSAYGWNEFTNIQPNLIASGTCGDNLTWMLTDEYELVIEGTGAMYDYVYNATRAPWFYNYSKFIQSATIKEGVTSIGEKAFQSCSSLTSITIPESVTSIGNYAFQSCSSLTSITIPEGVTSIGECAFEGCSSLTSITIPTSVTSIGYYAFYNCSSLSAVHISDIAAWCNIKFHSDASNPFCYAKNLYLNGELVTELTIPEGVTSIGYYAFYGCSSLTNITLPTSVTSIGTYAFSHCSNLTSINIPENSQLTSIGSSAFYGCSSLTTITLPTSVTNIRERAFQSCSSLTSITIPEGVTSIGDYAFEGCSSLTSITIPASVTSIGVEAFWDCTGELIVNCNIPSASVANTSVFEGSDFTKVTIGDKVTSIGDYAFYDCSNLTSITIPASVTSIGYAAFEETAWYNDQPDGVVYLDKWLLAYKGMMPNNTSIEVKEGTKGIGDGAFIDCFSLTSITIPESVTSIGDWAFYGCSSLTAITCKATVPPTIYDSYTFDEVDKSILVVYVPAGSVDAYRLADYWDEFIYILPIGEPAPTTVTITINQYGSGTFSSGYALDFSEVKGLKAYAAAGYDTETGVVTLLRVDKTKLGVGLFVKGTPGETYEVPIIESTSSNVLNMLVATLVKTSVNAYSNDGVYANYKYTVKSGTSEPLFYQFEDGSTLSAGKAYLQIPVDWLPAKEEQARVLRLRFDNGDGTYEDEGTTSIDNSQFTIQNSELIYDLLGRRVTSPQRGGLYIVNGKKVIY